MKARISPSMYEFMPITTQSDSKKTMSEIQMRLIYETGMKLLEKDTDKDSKLAAECFERVASQGHAAAQFALACAFTSGTGVLQDEKEAAVWYRRSAEQGHALAQNNLGNCFLNGVGVVEDEEQAVKWYGKSTDQGCAVAQSNLGMCLFNGSGAAEDKAQAVEWFKKSASQRYAKGQFSLGFCFLNGMGIDKDANKAKALFEQIVEVREVAHKTQFYLSIIDMYVLSKKEDAQKRWLNLFDQGVCFENMFNRMENENCKFLRQAIKDYDAFFKLKEFAASVETSAASQSTSEIVSGLAKSEPSSRPLKRGNEYVRFIKNVMKLPSFLDDSLLAMRNQWVHRLIELLEQRSHPGYESVKSYSDIVKFDKAGYPRSKVRDVLTRACAAVELGEKIELEKNPIEYVHMKRRLANLVNGIREENLCSDFPVLRNMIHKIYKDALRSPQEQSEVKQNGQNQLFAQKAQPTSYLSALMKNRC